MDTKKLMKTKKIKPSKTIHYGSLLYCCISFIVIFELMAIIACFYSLNPKKELIMFNIMIICIIVFCTLVCFCVRIFYNTFIEINEFEIVKYKHKKIIFKIAIQDIVELGYKKFSFKDFLLMPINFDFITPCSILSIRYRQAEVEAKRIYESIIITTVTEKEETEGIKDYCECLTKREIYYISKTLNIPLKEVVLVKKEK